MNNTQLTILRTAATAAITALAAVYAYYPHDLWITAAISAASAIGIHAIPSITQGSTAMTTPDPLGHAGNVLMGVTAPPLAGPTPASEPAQTAPEIPAAPAVTPGDPVAALKDAMNQAAAIFLKAADTL